MIAVLSALCYYKLNSRGGTGFGGKVINPCFGAVLSAIFTKYVHLIACMFLPFAAMQAVCLYMFLGESCDSRSARIANKLYKLPSLICINYAFFIFSYGLNSRIWMYPQRIGSSQMADKSVVEEPPRSGFLLGGFLGSQKFFFDHAVEKRYLIIILCQRSCIHHRCLSRLCRN